MSTTLRMLGFVKYKGNWFVWHTNGLEWLGVAIE